MVTRIKFRYSIAQYRPNLLRGEFVNIGILVHRLDTLEVLSKWLPGLGRMRCLSKNISYDEFKQFQDGLKTRYKPDNTQTILGTTGIVMAEPANTLSPDFLLYLHDNETAQFCFSEPVTGYTDNPEALRDRLYNELVAWSDEEETEAEPNLDLSKLKQRVYRQFNTAKLIGPEALQPNIQIEGKFHPWRFDFGRSNGHITLVQVLPPAQEAPEKKSESALLLRGKVEEVRNGPHPMSGVTQAYAVLYRGKTSEQVEATEIAKRLLDSASIVGVYDTELSELVRDIENDLEKKYVLF